MASTDIVAGDQTDLILKALCLNGNQPVDTARALRDVGLDLTGKQVETVRDNNRKTYLALRKQLRPQTDELAIYRMEDVRDQALANQRQAMEQVRVKLVEGSIKNPAPVAADMTKVAESMTRMVNLERGKPTERLEVRSVTEILQSLANKLPPNTIIDAEIIEEP